MYLYALKNFTYTVYKDPTYKRPAFLCQCLTLVQNVQEQTVIHNYFHAFAGYNLTLIHNQTTKF